MFRRCPIDARWSSWPSDWSSCSGNCKKRGEPVPHKSRSRTCLPGAFGGKNCSFLEDEARTNNELLYSEQQACSELPNCPRPATIGPWGEWSSCSQTCYPDKGTIPQAQRTRSCQEASLSSENSLNDGIFTCKDLKVKMSRNCEVSACPGKSRFIISPAHHFANFPCRHLLLSVDLPLPRLLPFPHWFNQLGRCQEHL